MIKPTLSRILAALTVASLATVTISSAAPPGRWDYREMPQEQIDFFDRNIPPIVETYKEKGSAAAIEELDTVWERAKTELGGTHYLYRAVWFEAQAYSGKQDQDWGLALYEFLYEKNITKNPARQNSPRLFASEYILCGNIMECCESEGKAALMRDYSLRVENSLQDDLGFDLSGASYTDRGPVFSFLDEARNRDYPIFHHDLKPETADSQKRDFFYYPTMYGVSFVAETALQSGDWIKAAELSAWCIRYANEYILDQDLMRGEVNVVCSYKTHKILSDLALLHDCPAEAARFLKEYIRLSEDYYQTSEWDLLRAKLDLAVVQLQTGELPANALELAEKASEKMADNWYYSRMENMRGYLNKARIHYALGQTEIAWNIIDDLLEKTAQDINPQYWLQILDTAIDLALADGAVRPELEEWLILALENARRTGNKFDELPLYEKYARFLMLKGRYVEAVQIQQEAIRLSRAMSLPLRLNKNTMVLSDIYSQLESVATADTTPSNDLGTSPDAVETPIPISDPTNPTEIQTGTGASSLMAVDIQPVRSISAPLKGEAAYGRFYLHNPSFAAQTGTLFLNGPIDQVKWQNDQWLTISASPVFESVELSRTISLPAGGSCIIDITGIPLEGGQGSEVRCRWTGPGQSIAAGSWSYRESETEKRTAIIDAHELRNNPYYLIPIHHMLQRTDASSKQTVDFTVEASTPLRIESYDAASGLLLAVDANGDGDFLDIGDLVVGDANRNNWPDLQFENGTKLTSLVMYVLPPAGGTIDTATELTIKTRTGTEWQIDAIDTINPN